MSLKTLFEALKGGAGSGNWGHAGIPGHRGGSMARSFAMSRTSGRDWQERQQTKKGKTQVDTQAIKKFEDKFNAEQDVKDISSSLSDLKSRVRRIQAPRHLSQAAWDSEKSRLRSLLPEREAQLREAKQRAASLKDVTAPGFGEYQKQSTETRMAGQKWTHPHYGEVSFNYSGKFHTQNIAASGTVTWKSPNGGVYSKNWKGQTALDSAKKYMSETFGIDS